MVLMVKGNTETYIDELLVEEYKEKGYTVVETDKDKKEDKKEDKKGK